MTKSKCGCSCSKTKTPKTPKPAKTAKKSGKCKCAKPAADKASTDKKSPTKGRTCGNEKPSLPKVRTCGNEKPSQPKVETTTSTAPAASEPEFPSRRTCGTVQPPALKPAVFLDRDGVINQGGLINKPEDFHLIAGVREAIIALKQAGFIVGVVTNQSGLSEDYDGNIVWKQRPLTREKLNAIHDEMYRLLGEDAKPTFLKLCPHAKKLKCACRKPEPGMINEAASGYNIDKTRSFMVGDMSTDIFAGINAGVTPLLVLSGYDPSEKDKCPAETRVFPSIVEAAAYIISTVPAKI